MFVRGSTRNGLQIIIRIRLFVLIMKIIKDRNRHLREVVKSPLLEVRQASGRIM